MRNGICLHAVGPLWPRGLRCHSKETALRFVFTPLLALLDAIDAQRGRLFLWVPVMLGVGIALYFAAPLEPDRRTYLSIGGGMGLILVSLRLAAWRLLPARVPPLLIGLFLVGLGFVIAGTRAQLIAAPVLNFRYYGPIEGRVIKIDRSASDALRLTLDRVTLLDMSRNRTPARVRVSLHGDQGFVTPEPGLLIAMTGHLSPPPGPAEPGGFDFQRMAWFDRLGAVGYTTSPALRAGPIDRSAALFVHRLRQTLSAALQSGIDGQAGAFAAAILTGDRSGISQETDENLRSANLSHLLAISGLHMGLLTGAVFGALRFLLACMPGALLHLPIKKIAAIGALCAGGFYLALSGWNVATERAFVMVSVMFVAVLFDRQAISMRAVAMAAILILSVRPEVLPEPGFQMSFAATTALVAVFSAARRVRAMTRWPRILASAATVVLSSAVAGLVTAPVAAAHFNRIADFGLVANVISVPVMGAVVMPAALLAAVLSPFGFEGVAFAVLRSAIQWILLVAETVAQWEGAVTRIISPPPQVVPLIAVGALFVILWRGRWKVMGLAPIVIGFALWVTADRPVLLVSEDGGLVGRLTVEGRALNKKSGAGFAARSWLENDGDIPDQERAAARKLPPLGFGGVKIVHITGREWQERVEAACADHDIVIVNQIWLPPWPDGCLLYDVSTLRRTGALAFSPEAQGVSVRTAYAVSGVRLWNTPELRGGARKTARDVKRTARAADFGGFAHTVRESVRSEN